jgi:hypothetical protein
MEMYGSYGGLFTSLLFLTMASANATVDCPPAMMAKPTSRDVEAVAGTLIPYPAIDPQQVVDVFMAAVGRGELLVFNEPLAVDALDPRQVEYVYALESWLPTVRVHAILRQPFPIPGAPNVRGTAVTGVLDWMGRFVDSILHCE